ALRVRRRRLRAYHSERRRFLSAGLHSLGGRKTARACGMRAPTVTGAADPSTGQGSEGVQTVRLRIPARPEYIALCRLALTGLAKLRPLEQELVEDLKLALTEACT